MRSPAEENDEAQLAPYVRDGRLLSYPRKWERRLEVLRWLTRGFDSRRTYSEVEVNLLLAGHEIDHVTLRRYLVDARLLEREGGRYWLAAGTGSIPAEID